MREKLAYVAQQKGVKSPVRYLSATLRDDFNAPKPAEPAAGIRPAMGQGRAVDEDEEAHDRAVAKARRIRMARAERVKAASESRNPTQRDADHRLFLSRLDRELERADFASFGWASTLNAAQITDFWEDLLPGIFEGIDEE